ncbi:Na+/H+ antiporter NhaA [Conexibacter sp. JD483]|uniref:Na+/H+ antiporter NhaA n=1 Tax=unclassified Conexibacter TaxID=2627773 RepID=UPI0027272E15|nr:MULTISPECIES: Na+/H+ antiporter NhaA [unclassified Conexibacter]MDO8188173.1 Na+/H+ antiporter NhaA [Conexibacter sp. CPCC 205706]MDO8201580.1 Na+/H+ antiporter NhaA [Conexibacter sp. CPCC 205762]MDR9373003.1 Na+/H+ antiporter NhaA [Conexibacter sp. JD483]
MSATTDQSAPKKRQLLAQLPGSLRSFIATEAGGAGLLLAATVIALVWANSPLSDSYDSLWHTDLTIRLGDWTLDKDLRHWLDEGLMALFFFVIGLEVRREWAIGELRDRARVTIPVIAGIGGMIVPALIFVLIAPSGEAAGGWGIVIATDTAFLLGAMAIVGPACPTQLRVFLLTLSIVDDIVAISVIGIFYSESIDAIALIVAALCLTGIALASRMGAWRGSTYILLGLGLWLATVISGLHPTIAGMAAGLLVTAYNPERERVLEAATQAHAFRQSPLASVARQTARSVERAVSPNERLQELLHPWTSFVVVPLFALANAGVDMRNGVLGDALSSPLTWAVVAGLVVGKTAGITFGSLGAIRARLGKLPQGVGEGQVVGGAALSGIGFTVSLLIAGLAFDSPVLQEEAKIGVLIAAALAVAVGWLAFKLAAVLRGEVSAGLPTILDPPVDPARDHVRGPVDAPMTLVEYADFECPFCGRATGMVKELRRRFGDDLRYVIRHLPLVDVHPHAELAAQAMEEAGDQGRFWELHDKLFDHQDELEFEDLLGYAGKLGIDVEEMARALQDGRHLRRVQEDVMSAEASGARGTPTFFVNGRRHVGSYDAESLASELLATRAAAVEPTPA